MSINISDGNLLIVRFGDFRLDFGLRRAYRGTEKLKISPIPFSTLEFLVQNRHRVVSKAELLETVWGGNRDVSTVEHAVSQLRRALLSPEARGSYIETVPGYGYRFVAQVLTPEPDINEKDRASPTADVASDPAANGIWHWVLAQRRRMSWLWITIVLVTCGAAVAVVGHFREPFELATVTTNGNALIAKGITGNVLWTYRFDETLREVPPAEANWRTRVVDLNGDGMSEVLVAAVFMNPPGPHGREELFCFSSRGKLLWRYRPEIHMEFNTRDLNGPWCFRQMIVVDEGPSSSIWVAVDHTVWWPSFLVRISPDGGRETMFTSSGSILALQSVRTKTASYVLAGGINNEYRMASVAVLAANGPPATSPQSDGAKYQCIRGCPSGRPYRYILLPRAEVNVASDRPYNEVAMIETRSYGFTIQTLEGRPTSQFFDFSEELQPQRVIYSSDYPEVHRRYEIDGRITHSFELCPERLNPAVVRIFDENGISRLVSVPREK